MGALIVIIVLCIFLILGVAALFTYFINPFREGYRQKLATNDTKITHNTFSENNLKEMGDEFERFTVTKFDTKYFKIIDWRSDKSINGIYPESNKNPDLEIEFSHNGISRRFSVECKYRTKVYDEILIAKPHKIIHYKNYSKNNKIPVFIFLGLGGVPSNPDECYIIPINKLHKETMHYNNLKQYKKYGSGNFFFNTTLLSLS